MMMLVKVFAVLLAFTFGACTLLPTQHGVAQFWGDYQNVTFTDGSVSFHADSMIHSNVVRAHWHGATLLGAEVAPVVGPAIGIAPRVVAPAVPAVVSGMTQQPRATPLPIPKKP